MPKMPPNATIEVNKAERDALAQVLAKAQALGLDQYERRLLQQLLHKMDK